jgi:peptidoglycan/xylan/chitin deacetylase (PgdA/CDA1 family)
MELIILFLIASLSVCFIIYQPQNLPAVPVLKYHKINNDHPNSFTSSIESFEKQLILMKRLSYKSIFLDELDQFIDKKKKIKAKLVAITFDDGFYDNYKNAFPLLKKYNIKATIFLSTYFIKTAAENGEQRIIPNDFENAFLNDNYSGFLNWSQIKEMHDSGLVSFEPHTHYHKHVFSSSRIIGKVKDIKALKFQEISCFSGKPQQGSPIFTHGPSLTTNKYDPLSNSTESTEEYVNRITDEISKSKTTIDNMLSKNSAFIAWPWGMHNNKCIRAAKRLGFKLCLTTLYGSNHFWTSKYKVKRFTPSGNTELFPEELLRNSFLLSSLCIDNKLYNILSKRFIRKQLKRLAI